MRVSVAILTRDRPQELRECLDSLACQTLLPHEVLLIDNSSDGVTALQIQSQRKELPFELIYTKGYPELGTSTGRNSAVAKTQGEIVLFLDDDIVLTDRGFIAIIRGKLLEDKHWEIGGVAAPANTSGPQSALRTSARMFLKTLFLLDSWRPGQILPSGFRSHWPNKTTWVQCLHGCAMAYRREVFTEFSFDPALEIFPYAMSEDQDFSFRVARQWKLLWTMDTAAWHKKSPLGARMRPMEQYLAMVQNHHYFMRKNLGHPWNHAAFWWAMVGVFLNCVGLLVARPCRANVEGLLGFLRGIKRAASTSLLAPQET